MSKIKLIIWDENSTPRVILVGNIRKRCKYRDIAGEISAFHQPSLCGVCRCELIASSLSCRLRGTLGGPGWEKNLLPGRISYRENSMLGAFPIGKIFYWHSPLRQYALFSPDAEKKRLEGLGGMQRTRRWWEFPKARFYWSEIFLNWYFHSRRLPRTLRPPREGCSPVGRSRRLALGGRWGGEFAKVRFLVDG